MKFCFVKPLSVKTTGGWLIKYDKIEHMIRGASFAAVLLLLKVTFVDTILSVFAFALLWEVKDGFFCKYYSDKIRHGFDILDATADLIGALIICLSANVIF